MTDRRLAADDDTQIAYTVRGRGAPPMVFVHGWCSNRTHWAAQLDHFAPRHRVLAIDRRGQGDSGPSPDGYLPARHAADLAQVMERERLGGAVVVGHAGGCGTVLTLAHRRPDLVAALALVDTYISPRTRMGRPGTAGRSPLGRLVDSLAAPDGPAAFEAMYRGFFSPHAGPVAERAVGEACRVPLEVARADLAGLAVDTEGPARRLRAPVLWLTVAAADEARLGGIFRDVTFGRVVGSGHFPHLEVPGQVNAMIERFVEVALG